MQDEFEKSWVNKYAPAKLDDMILDESLKNNFRKMIESKKIVNMTLYGIQGMGKTTLTKVLLEELGESAEAIVVNCGIDNSVDMVRNKVMDFVDAYIPGKMKIIIMDEADSLSGSASGTEGNSAQKALRSAMNPDDVIFILTCNNLGNLSPAIQSRCTPVQLFFNTRDVLARCIKILQMENIKFTPENIVEFRDQIVEPNFPDVRSIINQLQIWSTGGEFHKMERSVVQKEVDVMASKILEMVKSKVEVREISRYYIEHESEFNGNYEQLAASLFRLIYNYPTAQLQLSDAIFKMSQVVDKEIQFYSALMMTNQTINKTPLNG
jgi:DNA polymerase III delta prime subunit